MEVFTTFSLEVHLYILITETGVLIQLRSLISIFLNQYVTTCHLLLFKNTK